MLLRRYDRKGVNQDEQQKQLDEQGLYQVETGEVRDETDVTVTNEEDADMPKYSRAADRTRTVEKEEAVDYSTFTKSKLEGVKNDELKAYLDSKDIEYPEDAIKEDYIKAILGE